MSQLEKLDPNFALPAVMTEGLTFFDIRKSDVDIYGLWRPFESDVYCRMPVEVAESINPRIATLNLHTSGARIRFSTDSKRLAIRVLQSGAVKPGRCGAFLNAAGFDLYIYEEGRQSFWTVFEAPEKRTNGYEASAVFPDCRLREFVLNCPTFDGFLRLEIGIEEGCVLQRGSRYRLEKPVVFYGSSITQGAFASRPGNIYENILSRMLNLDFVNLGFSGGARGEQEMAEGVASVAASAYVIDYDHNAPNVEYLSATHEPFVRRIREQNPETPILVISRPNLPITPLSHERVPIRREVIRGTVEKLKAEGDRNIYFLDGQSFFAGRGDDCCTADGCHPNDFGFYRMAQGIAPVLQKILFHEGTEC